MSSSFIVIKDNECWMVIGHPLSLHFPTKFITPPSASLHYLICMCCQNNSDNLIFKQFNALNRNEPAHLASKESHIAFASFNERVSENC